MRADDGCYTAVEVPAEGDFLGRSFGMEVDEDDLCLDLLQKFVGEAEGVVAGSHEDAALQVDHGVVGAIFLAFEHSPAWQTRGEICRAQQSPRRAMRIAVCHLEVFDDFALIPDVIAGRHDIDAEIEEFVREWRRDTEPGSGIFAVGDHQIDGMLLYEFRQAVLDDGSSGTAKNVADEENVQESRSQVLGVRSRERQNRCRELAKL